MTELDPEARRILELTRQARTPSPDDKARVEKLLGASVGFAVSAHATGTQAAQAAGTKLASNVVLQKWLGIVLSVAALAGSGYAYLRTPTFQRDAGSPSAAPTAHSIEAVPLPDKPAPAPAREPEAALAMPTLPTPPPAELQLEPTPLPTPAPRSVRAAELASRSEQPASIRPELDLLHDVQLKWRNGDAASALVLLARHRARFPNSALAPERDALRVLCLCAVGRTDEARRRAQRFLASAPRSPLRSSVEESCAGH